MKRSIWLPIALSVMCAPVAMIAHADNPPAAAAPAAEETFEGTIAKVNAGEKEIYVDREGGKKAELYFTKDTKVMMKGQAAEFSALKKGQKVKVVAKKNGKKLVPISVDILSE